MNLVIEGKAKIAGVNAGKVSKKMGVFYNPVMKLNRDISILLLNSISQKKLQIADPLAGTGIRSIRMLLELAKNKIESISINDYSKDAINAVKKNLKLNRIRAGSRIKISQKDANIFLLESTGFDYIDIDPFGCPGKFLDSAAQRISRVGVMAVTATDTAALAGSSPSACVRKYWAVPLRNDFMHETGLRILIRRVQLAGMQYEKALIPIFSYNDQHYLRAFFSCKKGRIRASQLYKSHGYIADCRKCFNRIESAVPVRTCSVCKGEMQNAGPLWLGKLSDSHLISKMVKLSEDARGSHFLETIRKESFISQQWFYNINGICRKYRLGRPPNMLLLIEKLRKQGYKAERTHFDGSAVKTDAGVREIVACCK